MASQQRRVGGIVECDHNGLLFDSNVSFQTFKEMAGQMSGIPLREGRTQALAQLVKGSLGYQYHCQMTVADIEVERSGAVPAQSLIEFKELLDVPALRIVLGQSGNLRKLARA